MRLTALAGLVASVLCATATAQTLTVTATPQGSDHVITGTCVPGQGQPSLKFVPLSLTPPSYNGPKIHVPTTLAGDGTPGANGGCNSGGIGKSYVMKKSVWAKGQWKIKLQQGNNQSAAITVNL